MQGNTPWHKDHSLPKGLFSLSQQDSFLGLILQKKWETLKDLESCFFLAVCSKTCWTLGWEGTSGSLCSNLLFKVWVSLTTDTDFSKSLSQCLAANPYPLDYTGGPSYGNSRLFKPFLHWEVPNWPQYPGLAPAVTKRVGTSLPTLDSTPQPAWPHLFTLQKHLCSAGSSLGGTQNPEKGFRVLLILLGVCLGKKA